MLTERKGKPFVVRKLNFEDLNQERRNTMTDKEKLFIERKEIALKDYLGTKSENQKAAKKWSVVLSPRVALAKIPYRPIYVEHDCILYHLFQQSSPLSHIIPIELWESVARLMGDTKSV
jgi:hypothetical protein